MLRKEETLWRCLFFAFAGYFGETGDFAFIPNADCISMKQHVSRLWISTAPMIDPLVSLTILDFQTLFQPGALFRWEFQIDAVENGGITAVENSILWYTSGKGDEDIGVHFFERRVPKKNEFVDLTTLRRYETDLPKSPITYDGFLLKINWCVRVRVFLKGGKEVSGEIPFQLIADPSTANASIVPTPASSNLRVVGI